MLEVIDRVLTYVVKYFQQVELDAYAKDDESLLIGIEHQGAFHMADYIQADKQFVKNPSLDELESQLKIVLLFRAFQNEMRSDGTLQLESCH